MLLDSRDVVDGVKYIRAQLAGGVIIKDVAKATITEYSLRQAYFEVELAVIAEVYAVVDSVVQQALLGIGSEPT